MRQRKSFGFGLALLVGAAILIGTTAAAATSEREAPIAEMRITRGGVDWLPLVDQGLSLTVGGPEGVVLAREFAPGEAPSLGLVDDRGERFADGVYAYELRPVAGAAGDRIAGLPRVLSGYLTVRDGGFVVPDPDRRPGMPESAEAGSAMAAAVETPSDLVLDEPLVVDDSACIGEECIAGNPESAFGSLAVKSLVPRILFQDPFDNFSPFRDWAIQINDFIGGGEYFAVQDWGIGDPPFLENVPFTLVGGAPTHSLVVHSNGNVGLGTSVPGAKLHLFGTATADVFGSAGPSPATGPAFNFGYGGASFGRGAGFFNARPDASATAPNPSLRFLTANVERMIVTNTGDVGIGTSAPAAPVHVKRAAAGLLLQLESPGDVYLREKNSTTGEFVDINYVNEEFRINFSTGGVGPELRLTNAGNLIINGGYTPDYVFEPDYELMPLAELAEFVGREKHLPNVPNAAEIAEHGLNVNEFPMRLLEKIEELTLYAIAQQETIDELRARLEAIEQRDAAAGEPAGTSPGG